MTDLIKQRGEYDCGVATFAMYLGRSYEEALVLCSEVFGTEWDPNMLITHNFQLLTLQHAGEPSALVVQLNPSRPAIVATVSLNHEGSGHLVYWDGHAVFDPSLGRTFVSFETMMSCALGFTQRIADLSS